MAIKPKNARLHSSSSAVEATVVPIWRDQQYEPLGGRYRDPAVSERGAERVRFSTEQVILLVACWQRVPLVSSGGPKNAFELRLEGMFVEEKRIDFHLRLRNPVSIETGFLGDWSSF